MDGTEVGIFEKTNKVRFGSLLQGKNSSTLETEVTLEILSNFTDQTLERSLADEEIRRLLILADLAESYSSWAVTVRLLHTSGGGGGLAGSLTETGTG